MDVNRGVPGTPTSRDNVPLPQSNRVFGPYEVALRHERLPNAQSAAKMKAYWRERLVALKALMERQLSQIARPGSGIYGAGGSLPSPVLALQEPSRQVGPFR